MIAKQMFFWYLYVKLFTEYFRRDKNSLESQIAKMKLSLERREEPDCYKRGSDAVEQQLREERSNLEAEVRRLKVGGMFITVALL